MSTFNVNIPVDAIVAQHEQQNVKRTQNTFNVKNYLQARLGDNEDYKEMTIRLLPFNEKSLSPFYKVHMHQVKVNKEVSPSGWKRFPCPVKNNLGDKCPFCETAAQSRELKKTATLEATRKTYEEIEMANYPNNMWIVRCIERGHEEDGVKFWLFSDSKKKDGVYDKIYEIFKKRKEKGKNIFDLNEGKDIFLTLTKDSMGKTVIKITDDDEYTPLTTNYEQGVAWINDSKKWTDVYTVKPYEYMSIVVQGGVPVYSQEKNCYVDKHENEQAQKQEIERNLTSQTVDMSKGFVVEDVTMSQIDDVVMNPLYSTQNSTNPSIYEDDLPF